MSCRAPEFGWVEAATDSLADSDYLRLFKQISFNRHFEFAVAGHCDRKEIRIPIYLSVGQEHIPAVIASVTKDLKIFAQHRAHSYYLSFGGDPRKLVDELRNLTSGCAGGMGGSASIHCPESGMFGHSGLMGDQVPIAVGYALVSKNATMAVVGDGSGEEDYVLGAMGFAATKKVPVLFVCEDNDLSILTKTSARRSWGLAEVARSFGMGSVDIADDPLLIAHHVKQAMDNLPFYINIRTCRQLWHAGTGRDGLPEWNRFEMIKAHLAAKGYGDHVTALEQEAISEVEALWV